MSARNMGELGVNLQAIVSRLIANQNLLKLLYYTDKDPYNHDDISEAIIKGEIFEKLIKVIPLIEENEDGRSIVALRVAGGKEMNNDQFRNIEIIAEILVPMTHWAIKDSNLRPFAIMGELQKTLDNKNVNGLGTIHVGDFELAFTTAEMSDYYLHLNITQYD